MSEQIWQCLGVSLPLLINTGPCTCLQVIGDQVHTLYLTMDRCFVLLIAGLCPIYGMEGGRVICWEKGKGGMEMDGLVSIFDTTKEATLIKSRGRIFSHF